MLPFPSSKISVFPSLFLVCFTALYYFLVLSAGKCITNNETSCQQFGYNKVSFPNFAGMRSPLEAAELIRLMFGINHATKCYKYTMMFACTALMPKCSGSGRVPSHAVPPCRSLCNGNTNLILCKIKSDPS